MPSESHRSTKMRAAARRCKISCRTCGRLTEVKAPVRQTKIVLRPRNSTTMAIRKGTANAVHHSDAFKSLLYGSLIMEHGDDYYTQICPALTQWRKEKFLCDVTLVSKDNVEIYAHKVLLIGVSPFFLAKFANFDGNRVLLGNFYSSTLETLVNYAYNKNDLTIDDNNAEALLAAADYLGMIALKNLCCNYLSSKICVLSCVRILTVADRYTCKSLLNSSYDFVKKHFTEVIKDENFLSFPSHLLLKMIRDDDLNVFSEMIVYVAVMKWLKHNWENRLKYLCKLMLHVRLPFLGADRLFRLFRSDFANISDTIQRLDVQQLFWNAIEEENSRLASSLAIPDNVSIPRVSYSSIPKLFVIGGQNHRSSRMIVDCFDIRGAKRHSVTELDDLVFGPAAVATRNKIYVTSGRIMKIFDMKANEWVQNTITMPCRRSNHASVLLDNKIYVIAGNGTDYVPLTSVSFYCLEKNEWHEASDMMEPREYTAAAVLNGMIYVVGGNQIVDDTYPSNTVEIYDPVTSSWSHGKHMIHARCGAAAIVVDNLLYVVGGDDDGNFGNRFEVYDPVADEWQLMPNLPVPRKFHGVCHDNGYLFVVGGRWNESCVSRIDVFCLFTRKWYETGLRLDVPRHDAAVVMAYESPN